QIHGGLKPANVLLAVVSGQWSVASEDKEWPSSSLVTGHWSLTTIPKITDFGLAKQLEDEDLQTQVGIVMGSPSYMAPEQAAAQPERMGPAVDIHALGGILYEMLTGRPPVLAEAALDTLLQAKVQDPVPPRRLLPAIPRDMESICLKCLRKEPGK